MSGLSLPARLEGIEPVRRRRMPAALDYQFTAGHATSRFLSALAQGRLVAQRCPSCQKVYLPPRGVCPTDGVPTVEEIELAHVGTVTSFCIVNVAFYGQAMELPYVSALILVDGTDIPLMHLIQEVPYDEVHMGMRVEAVWVPDDELGPTLESIRHFRPTGEPDADYDTYKDNV